MPFPPPLVRPFLFGDTHDRSWGTSWVSLMRTDVEQIHEDIKMGRPIIKEIAKDYNVTRGHISNIKNGHTWKGSEA